MATQSAAPPNPTDGNPPNPATEPAQPTNQDQQESGAEAPNPKSTPSGSPVIYRRSFLEKKGLTKEEIDEAFRLVPVYPPPSAQSASVNQDGLVKSSSSIQQAPVQTLQPAAAAPTAAISSVGTLTRFQFHWSHAILAVGLLAVSGAGTAVVVKNAILPRLKSWIRKVALEEENDLAKKKDSKPSLAEEAAAAAKAAAAAAADVAKASQEMLRSKNEDRRFFEEFTNLLDVQVREMKAMTNAISKLEGQTNTQGRASFVAPEDHRVTISSSKQSYVHDKADYDSRSVRSSSPPAAAEPSVAPHPKSYMEIMAMVQRGERPPNIKDINDLPPNPNQQPSNPRLAPIPKPWEVSQAQTAPAKHFSLNSVPWWQRKNVKITEIENEDELKAGSFGVRTNEQPVQRRWVPPQPPPVAMAEAAEAIRRPKPSVPREQLADDQSVAHPSDVTDELQRITKISESGGAVETNGGSPGLNSSEIQEDDHTFEQS
ncbi:hypothetical protein SLA2020_440360 [Shorea laevis]